MRALKYLFAILALFISAFSIVGISVNADTIKSNTDELDKYHFRLKNSLEYPFEEIDNMVINLDIENSTESYKGAVSFFSGINTFIYKEFGTSDTGLENVVNEDGVIKIEFDSSDFTTNLPYLDIYVSALYGDISISSIDFYGGSGEDYYYTISSSDVEQSQENIDVPIVFNFIKSNIFRNSADITKEDEISYNDNTECFSIQKSPVMPYIKYGLSGFSNYPQIFNFYSAIAEIKSTYTLFNNGYMQADANKTAFNIKTTISGGDFSVDNISNNSFIYAVYAIDKSDNYSDQDAMALTISDGKYTMKVPPAQTMSINDYLNAIYGSMTVDKILHSTFSDEQISKMTRKELYQIRQLIAAQIEKTFGSVDTVMNELDKMVKTNISSDLSVNSIYVSAFLPEDIRKIAELKFNLSDMTDFAFVAQKSKISLIEAYCASTKNNTAYVSSIADGNIIYDSFKYNSYESNKPAVTTSTNSSSESRPSNNNSISSSGNSSSNNDKNNSIGNVNSGNQTKKDTNDIIIDESGLNNSNLAENHTANGTTTTNKASNYYNDTYDKMIDGNPGTNDKGILGIISIAVVSATIGYKIKKKHSGGK